LSGFRLKPGATRQMSMSSGSDPATPTLVQRARDFAIRTHRRIDQRRKYSNQAYEVHLKAVADLVASVSGDEEMLAAAWLHDSVEDTPATLEDIEREFGDGVARLVADLTDVSRPGDGNRAVRKAIDRAHSAQASPRAKTVKLADLTDNCRDICKHDPRFARVFVVEMAALLEVLGEGDARLYQLARTTLEHCAGELAMPLPATPEQAAAGSVAGLTDLDRETATRHGRTLRLFMRAFTAEDIAEPLRSFDGELDAGRIAGYLQDLRLDVAGLRQAGRVSAYVQKEAWDGQIRLRHFKHEQVVDGEASLTDVVHVLTRHDYCFVRVLDDIAGVIGRGDMQKPFVRMWLFGFITFTEMQVRERIVLRWPDESWTAHLSAARLQKAQALRDERLRRGQSCQLLDCVQVSDQAQILMTVPEELEAFGFESRSAAKRVIKEFESLRNNLAHAQDIVTYDWAQIARMAQRLEEMAKEL